MGFDLRSYLLLKKEHLCLEQFLVLQIVQLRRLLEIYFLQLEVLDEEKREEVARRKERWRLRAPYVKTLCLTQVTLLRELRAMPEGPERERFLREYVLPTVIGVAVALGETG